LPEASESLVMLSGTGHSLEVFSRKSMRQVLRLDKKGDFGITCFDCQDKLIVFSDGTDTQIFSFDMAKLNVTKLTKKVCFANNLSALPPCVWIQVFKPENEEA
jgi:hypothetical protein